MNRALIGVLFLALFFFGCSQSAKVTGDAPLVLTKPDLDFFEQCSRIDTSLDEIWVLLCRKDSHPQRQELYEYSTVYKKFRRLTFQDGIITSLAVRDFEDIYYSSSYDESKEQFVDVLKGQKPGTDIYIKKRTKTDFERLTTHTGQEKDLFWSAENYQLYFVHSAKGLDRILSMDRDHKQTVQHFTKTSEILSPVVLKKTKALYWVESLPGQTKYTLFQKLKKKSQVLFHSPSRMLMMKPDHRQEELLIAFVTGLGREIWGFNPETKCWQLKLRSTVKWDFFHPLNDDEVFLNLEDGKGLQLQSLHKPENNCEPSPPGLGIEVVP